MDQPGTEYESKREGYASSDNREPAYFAALLPGEELLGFRAGKEHEQEQAEPINKVENVFVLAGGVAQSCGEGQPSDESRPQYDARQDFAHNLGLAQPDEEPSQQLGGSHQS